MKLSKSFLSKHALIPMMAAVLFIFAGCRHEAVPMQLGFDECAHCKMKIMDDKFGAEIVSSKGKVMKFDAAECLVQYLQEYEAAKNNSSLYVIDFDRPSEFLRIQEAEFIVSSSVHSPMGGQMYSVKKGRSRAAADSLRGEVYSWNKLIESKAGGDS